MINLNINESKNIEFDVSISGTESENIIGFLRFMKENIEYGFPVKVNKGSLEVTIPKLSSFINSKLNEGEKIEARLDIIANGDTYIIPWKDTISIEKPFVMEAKIKNMEKIKETKPKVSISKIFESKEKVKKEPTLKNTIKSKFGKTLEG